MSYVMVKKKLEIAVSGNGCSQFHTLAHIYVTSHVCIAKQNVQILPFEVGSIENYVKYIYEISKLCLCPFLNNDKNYHYDIALYSRTID